MIGDAGIGIDELTADGVEVDDTQLDDIQPSKDVQVTLVKLYNLSKGSSRGFTFCQYNGNANSGRFLEFFSGIDSNTAPLYSPLGIEVIAIVAQPTGTSATCTIGWYNDTTLLHTTTFSNVKRVIEQAQPIFALPVAGELKVKIDSGSITKPHIYFIVRGSA